MKLANERFFLWLTVQCSYLDSVAVIDSHYTHSEQRYCLEDV